MIDENCCLICIVCDEKVNLDYAKACIHLYRHGIETRDRSNIISDLFVMKINDMIMSYIK